MLRRAVASGGEATDCAGLVEAAGGRVKVVEGDPRLLKVTTADDLAKIASCAVIEGETLVEDAGGRSHGRLRVGTGFDAHAFEDGVPLVLGGVRIEHPRGLAGHSDGDVLAHALTDAVLGAAGMEDIGALFPSGDPALAGADSIELLREAWRRVREAGWELVNADVVLIGEEPRLAPHRDAMRARLADALGVEPERVAVRATTTDGLGFTGRREGLAAQAVALLRR